MPTLKDLLADPSLLDRMRGKPQTCAGCGEPLSGFLTGKNPSPKGIVCNDCYYEQLGNEIEKCFSAPETT